MSIVKGFALELEEKLSLLDESYTPTLSDIQALNEWAVILACFGNKKQDIFLPTIGHNFVCIYTCSVADQHLFTALQSSENILGEDHPMTMIILNNLVTLYTKTEK